MRRGVDENQPGPVLAGGAEIFVSLEGTPVLLLGSESSNHVAIFAEVGLEASGDAFGLTLYASYGCRLVVLTGVVAHEYTLYGFICVMFRCSGMLVPSS